MDNLFCECGNATALIDGVCGSCISKHRKAIKKIKRDSWAAMTDEQRVDYKFAKYIEKTANA